MRVVPGTIEGVDIILIPKVVNIQPAQRDPRMLETATRMCSDARRRGLPRTYLLTMQVRSASRSLRFARPHNRLDLDANSGRAARSSFQTLPAGKTISPAKRASAVTGSSSNTRVSAPLGMSSSYIAAARHLDVFDEHPCLKCTGQAIDGWYQICEANRSAHTVSASGSVNQRLNWLTWASAAGPMVLIPTQWWPVVWS